MEVRGVGDVVNLSGNGTQDVTQPNDGFTLSGRMGVYGVADDTLTQLSQQMAAASQTADSAAAHEATNGTLSGVSADTSNALADQQVAPSVQLFHDAIEEQPGHLAATEDAQLFDDAVPAVTAAASAQGSLFDGDGENDGQPAAPHADADVAVSLFGDEPAAEDAAKNTAASGDIQVTTSSDDDEEEKEKEEEARAVALKAKGADIGIESEGAGVNLAG